MRPRQRFTCAAAFALFASQAGADPICAAMRDTAGLEPRYHRLAPIHNAKETGWIFGSDQFENDYPLTAIEQGLLTRLVEALKARGVTLAMLVAPPRPVIAGQAIVDGTVEHGARYDMEAEARGFATLMAQLAAAGAMAPDLQALVMRDTALRTRYYFARDTHWTSLGAARSALALAAQHAPDAPPRFALDALEVVEMFQERGALSDIVRATCGSDPEWEVTPVYNYTPHLPDVGGLFGDVDAEAPRAVLLGTSFSDRYRRDQYQVADALSAALGMTVTNQSVSGGGMIGPFETFILSGALAADPPTLLIWEFPYTYELREVHLRQLLGALRAAVQPLASKRVSAGGKATTIPLPKGTDLVGLRPLGATPLKLRAKIRLADGSAIKLPLARKKRMAEMAALDTWWIDLSSVQQAALSLSIEHPSGSAVTAFDVLTPKPDS